MLIRTDTRSRNFFCSTGPAKMIPSACKTLARGKKMTFHLTKFFRSRWWWWYCTILETSMPTPVIKHNLLNFHRIIEIFFQNVRLEKF